MRVNGLGPSNLARDDRRARRVPVDRLRLRRHASRHRTSRSTQPNPRQRVRPFEARRRARARSRTPRDRAHVVGLRRARPQHGAHDPAPARTATRRCGSSPTSARTRRSSPTSSPRSCGSSPNARTGIWHVTNQGAVDRVRVRAGRRRSPRAIAVDRVEPITTAELNRPAPRPAVLASSRSERLAPERATPRLPRRPSPTPRQPASLRHAHAA